MRAKAGRHETFEHFHRAARNDNITLILPRSTVSPQSPGEGPGDPSATGGGLGGRLREPHSEELGPHGDERRGSAPGGLQSGPRSDPAGQHGGLRPQSSAVEHHQETK